MLCRLLYRQDFGVGGRGLQMLPEVPALADDVPVRVHNDGADWYLAKLRGALCALQSLGHVFLVKGHTISA